MTSIKSLFFVTMTLGATPALSQILPEIPQAPQTQLPIDPSEPNIACDQILARLEKYNQMAREHDGSVAGFLGEVTQKLVDWYDLLSPFENSDRKIPVDTFQPLLRGSDQVANITNLAFDNSDLLAIEMEKIIASLRNCPMTTTTNK